MSRMVADLIAGNSGTWPRESDRTGGKDGTTRVAGPGETGRQATVRGKNPAAPGPGRGRASTAEISLDDAASAARFDRARRCRSSRPLAPASRPSASARWHPAGAHLSEGRAGSRAAGTVAGFTVRDPSEASRGSSPIRARSMHPASGKPLPRLPGDRRTNGSRSAAACRVPDGWLRPWRHRGSG